MRLAVLSDTHGNAVAFEAVAQDLRRQSPDAFVFLGDLAMRGPQPAECIDLLRSLDPLVSIKGNHDHYFARYRDASEWVPKNAKEEMNRRQLQYNQRLLSSEEQHWVGHWPTEHVLHAGNIQAELYHASPASLAKITWPWAANDELDALRKDESTQLVLYGHIHHAFVRSANGRLIVNSGSIGLPFDGDNRASYALIDVTGRDIAVHIRRIAYDIDQVVRIAKDRNMPDVDLFEEAVRKAAFTYGLATKAV
ncbi:metallophosphoesterase family protein [Paenibacillus allorhizosphaerae]|uniref:3',5'-cyclic adenosine monophosphate phosphodiesterase CpdA n=1 Tax=Paenibacillus allorhizosphaerae TaxID=2849866 RepID=A0ABN7TQM4_9BACL|nr:metallophosphoesterase family protein [Paenibacillus allorhizosphaerae]CAG7646559.1 3',5'-cyclic adenosine monophosphate phosphodiesterase CpdA [Paenibacillus allorhizosphaerae]